MVSGGDDPPEEGVRGTAPPSPSLVGQIFGNVFASAEWADWLSASKLVFVRGRLDRTAPVDLGDLIVSGLAIESRKAAACDVTYRALKLFQGQVVPGVAMHDHDALGKGE